MNCVNIVAESGSSILAGLFVILWAVISLLKTYWKRRRLPPGPRGLPLIGNKHQVPPVKPWRKFEEWNKEYGPVISLHLGKTPVIVLGTAQAAWDLLDRRCDIYSSRPRFVVASEILSNNMRGLMLPNGEAWRKWRKVLHSGFHARRAEKYTAMQSLESKVAMQEILLKPRDWERTLQRYAASIATSAAYGRRVKSVDEWIVKENMAAMDYLTSVNIPGKYLVESWPWLLRLPRALQWFRREPEEYRQRDIRLYTELLNDVKIRMEKGTAPDCLASQALMNEGYIPDAEEGKVKKTTMTELEIAYAVSTPFGAGIETTAGTMSSFVLAMLHFPNVKKKAQDELDVVIGAERMPEYKDREFLPYVRAVMNETLRWRPVAVLGGTPHAVTADNMYNEMFIPRGSTVFGNLAGIMNDPVMFPSPEDFIPERFLPTSHLFNPKFEPFDLPFGFGRRACPGVHFARNALFINIARVLWAFEILPALDDNGQDVLPDPWDYTNGFNSRPTSFQCRFLARSTKVVDILGKEGEIALEELRKAL